jgi:rubrerythrin
MDAYEFAKKMEIDGEKYYRKLASEHNDQQLKSLFNMLADDEVRHYEIIENMQSNEVRYSDTDTFKNVKNLFRKRLDEGKGFDIEVDNLEAYKEAVDIEVKSAQFYHEHAKKTEDEAEKHVLQKLASEEERHKVILENLMEFIEKGKTWVESPEFSHLEEYDEFTQRDNY